MFLLSSEYVEALWRAEIPSKVPNDCVHYEETEEGAKVQQMTLESTIIL
jgi:hypothetical protein